jgi:photosystem II stability/assembly factor-like uncharacterized protein
LTLTTNLPFFEVAIFIHFLCGAFMKKIGLVFCLVLFFSVSFQVSAQWEWQNPLPQGNSIFSIEFVNEEVGWMAGDLGKLLKTIDGGNNWNFQYSSTDQAIYDLSFVDENIGWASCHSGVIIHTTNGGKKWITQDSGRVGWLHSIEFINQNEGWSVGYYNNLFHTTDAGLHWTIEQLGAYPNELSSIFSLDENYGWITGYNEIFKTSNGGQDWVSIPGTSFRKLFFTSENVGWGIGSLGKISKTTDGGITWQEQLNTGLDNFESINFLDDFKGYVTAWFGRIYYTEDGGKNWEMIQLDKDKESILEDVDFAGDNKYLVVGQSGIMFKSFDGGNSWERMDKYGLFSFSDLQFINDNVGWIVGSAIAYNSVNGGKTWDKKLELDGAGIEAISFIDEQNGWIIGSWLKIYHTSDAGRNWDTLNTPVTGMFNDIQFFKPGIGYLCAPGYPKIFKTTDKGYNWSELTVPVSNDFIFNRIFFTDEKNGWIIAKLWLERNHKLLHTKDGGETWQIAYEIDTEYLWDIFFSDDRNGWVGGDSGIVLKTQDGGINWQIIHTENEKSIHCLFFKNESEGYIGGVNGYIASTSDGGYTWKPFQTWCNNHIEKLYVFEDNTGIAVGGNGTILRNNDISVNVASEESIKYINSFHLSQNHPNPFNPSTKISWQAPVGGWQTLKVYDILGNEVATLVDEYRNAGSYNAQFTINNVQLSSGVYFYQLRVGNYLETKKMVLLK